MQEQPDGKDPKRGGKLGIYTDNGDCNSARAVKLKQRESVRLLEALGELDVACIAHTVDFATLSNPNLQPHWNATMVSPDDITRALREDETDRTVFGYLWLAVRKLVEQNVRDGSIDRRSPFTDGHQLEEAVFDQFLAELGCAMMDLVEGRHITFLPLPASANSDTIVGRARRLLACFTEQGRAQDQVVISIPATAEGIDAGRILQADHGILVNLMHVAGPDHAAACAEAGVYAATLLSIPPESHKQSWDTALPLDNSVLTGVQATAACFRTHDPSTLLISGALTHMDDACTLASLDALTFTTKQASQAEFYTDYPPMQPGERPGRTRMLASTLRVDHGNVPPRQRKGKLYDVMQLGGANIRGSSSHISDIGYDSVRAIMGYIRSELYWRISLTRSLTGSTMSSMTPARPDLKPSKRQRNSPGDTAPIPKRSKLSDAEGIEVDCLPTPPTPSQTREQIAKLSSSLVDGSWRRRLFGGSSNAHRPPESSHPTKTDENTAPVDAVRNAEDIQKTRSVRPLPRRAPLSQVSPPLDAPAHAASTFGVDDLF